jgi:hypothetical protein
MDLTQVEGQQFNRIALELMTLTQMIKRILIRLSEGSAVQLVDLKFRRVQRNFQCLKRSLCL